MMVFESGKVFAAEIWKMNWKTKRKAETSFQNYLIISTGSIKGA